MVDEVESLATPIEKCKCHVAFISECRRKLYVVRRVATVPWESIAQNWRITRAGSKKGI